MGQGSRRHEFSSLDRIGTLPNALSLLRILLIPAFVVLILREGTEAEGLMLLAAVAATDWIDGYIARRMGQVTRLGKLLDPVADRLALAAAVVALLARGAFPLWGGLLVLARDASVLAAAAFFMFRLGVRVDVSWVGKGSTFALMCGIPLLAWAEFGLVFASLTRPVGWALFALGIAGYYAAALLYALDLRGAVQRARRADREEVQLRA